MRVCVLSFHCADNGCYPCGYFFLFNLQYFDSASDEILRAFFEAFKQDFKTSRLQDPKQDKGCMCTLCVVPFSHIDFRLMKLGSIGTMCPFDYKLSFLSYAFVYLTGALHVITNIKWLCGLKHGVFGQLRIVHHMNAHWRGRIIRNFDRIHFISNGVDFFPGSFMIAAMSNICSSGFRHGNLIQRMSRALSFLASRFSQNR